MYPITGRQSRELKLLLACMRWPQREEDVDLIKDLSGQDVDWQQFLLLAQHHRIVPLVSVNLSSAHVEPSSKMQPVLAEFQRTVASNAFNSLRCLRELRRLTDEIAAAGISVRVLKGLPLAQQVFGDLSLRMCGDIDLLIEDGQLETVDQILRVSEYRGLFEVQALSPRKKAFYRFHWKDLTYHNPQTGYEVDLHWRLFRNREMPGGSLREAANSSSVVFGEFHVRTFSPIEGLVYLCVHGTIDGWLYLKSLADVAAQVRGMAAVQLDLLASTAARYDVLPELSVGMHLVRRYLGMDHWSSEFLSEEDPRVRHSLRYADYILERGGFLRGRDNVSSRRLLAFELNLRTSMRYRTEVLIRILYRWRMWIAFPLPDSLFGIYPLLSPIEWVVHRVRGWQSDQGAKT